MVYTLDVKVAGPLLLLSLRSLWKRLLKEVITYQVPSCHNIVVFDVRSFVLFNVFYSITVVIKAYVLHMATLQ